MSPDCTSASGPPAAASGQACSTTVPYAVPAHADVGNTDHIADALAQKFRRQQHVAHLGHARIAAWAAMLEDHHAGFVDVQTLAVNLSVKFFNAFKDDRSPAMLQQVRTRC